MWEIALFSGKIYTAGTNFTRPPVVKVATNLNSVKVVTKVVCSSRRYSESRNWWYKIIEVNMCNISLASSFHW